MNPTQLLVQFDRISEAPDAIPRLRRFILDLAVRGKLIEQDPRDEPASELLKRIQVERERHSTDGAVRKNRDDSQVDVNEIPFRLPKSWAHSSLGEVARYGIPEKIDSNKEISANTWVLDLEDIEKDSSRLIERVLSSSRPFQSSKTRFNKGDVLFGKLRPYLNKVVVADADGVCTTEIVPIRGFCEMAPEYIRLVLKSPLTMKRVDRLMYGMKMPRLGTDDALALIFPLPPFVEQQRIVAKVEELMALCDRLKAAQAERESQRSRLVASSLHRLNNGTDHDVFREHARFYFNRVPRLTTRTEHIQQLRQTILNLAVRGRLVHQDPNDEPASELLIRIQAERARLLKEGKIGSEKPPIPARAGELAFEIKPGWQAARISQILVELQTGPFGSSLHQSDYQRGGIPVINPASIKNERLVPVESMAVGPKTLQRLATFKLRAGDIVMARRGEMGRCAFVTKQENGWLCGTGSLILRLPEFVFPHFFVTLIGSPFVREYLGSSAVGATMQNLNQSILLNLVIGLPPLAEQHRIVAKVEELMSLCDRLEAQLTTTQAESRRLLEAVLHEALSA